MLTGVLWTCMTSVWVINSYRMDGEKVNLNYDTKSRNHDILYRIRLKKVKIDLKGNNWHKSWNWQVEIMT